MYKGRNGDRTYIRQAEIIASNITRDPSIVEDIVAEAAYQMYRDHEKYDPNQKFMPYFAAKVSWLCLEALRRKRRRHFFSIERHSEENNYELESLDEGLEAKFERVETSEELAAILDTLTPKLRAAAYLCWVYGFSQEEAASILGIPHNTIRTRLFNAKARLKALLDPSGALIDATFHLPPTSE